MAALQHESVTDSRQKHEEVLIASRQCLELIKANTEQRDFTQWRLSQLQREREDLQQRLSVCNINLANEENDLATLRVQQKALHAELSRYHDILKQETAVSESSFDTTD